MVGFVVFHTLSSTAQLLAPHPDLRCRTSPSIWTLRRNQPVQSFLRLDYIFTQLQFSNWRWGWRVSTDASLRSALRSAGGASRYGVKESLYAKDGSISGAICA